MRVLLTTDTIGGVWTFTHHLAQGLLDAGHQVALVSFGRLPSPAQSTEMHALMSNFPADFRYIPTGVPLEWMQENDRTWPEGLRAIKQVMRHFKPDLLHSSQFCFGSLSTEVPVLITAHSDVLSWAESTLAGIEALEQTTPADWLQQYCALVNEGLRAATAVVAPTNWMAVEVTRLYHLHQVPAVIANGISPPQPATVQRKLQAITAGRIWDQAKGFSILVDRVPPFPVLVAGEHLPTSRFTSVHLLGPQPYQDLLNLFAESAIYLATSVYEPFGLAPLEAAQCGCAILVRDIPTLREVWGDAALYFHSGDTLQHLLDSLATHPRRLKAAQCRARSRASRYTAQIMTEQYLALYEEILTSQERLLTHA